jgi:hypothetical protein
MAAADSANRLEGTAHRSIFINRVDRVLAARGGKTALPAEELAERRAVEQHK